LTEEEIKAMKEWSESARVLEAIYKRPAVDTFVSEGATIRLNPIKPDTLSRYKTDLIDEANNIQKFDTLMAALENGEEVVAVRSSSATLLGLRVSLSSGVEANTKEESLITKEALKNVLMSTGAGYIAAPSKEELGAKLRVLEPSKKEEAAAILKGDRVAPKRFNVVVGNANRLRKEGNPCIKYAYAKTTEDTEEKVLNSELSFRIKDPKDKDKIRTIRLRGVYKDFPVFELNEEYVKIAPAEKRTDSRPVSDTEATKIGDISHISLPEIRAPIARWISFSGSRHSLIRSVSPAKNAIIRSSIWL
jgi:hypothetical protein